MHASPIYQQPDQDIRPDMSCCEGNLACVASIPVRSERNRRAKESFGPREKWGERKRVGERKEGNACQPLDFEKRPLVFTVEFIY